MVEPQIVVLVVAGSSPVGHPVLLNSSWEPGNSESENSSLQCLQSFGGLVPY